MSDDQEFGEPPDELLQPLQQAEPVRVVLLFTAVDDKGLESVIEAVAAQGEANGLFFEWGAVGPLGANDVIPGSALDQALASRS